MTQLSVVVPAYNAALFIAESVALLDNYLAAAFDDYEIIVVDDGSGDDTYRVLCELKSKILRLKSHQLEKNQGKFAAIKAGVQIALGSCIIFTDADIPFELATIKYAESLVNGRGFHIVIGDRTLKSSVYMTERTFLRRVTSVLFSHLVRILVAGGLFDTQCGFKAFRADVAKLIFPLLTNTGFAGDVELLYIALKHNLEIKRIPVKFRNSEASTVSVFAHSIDMLKNIIKLKLNWRKGLYYSKKLEELGVGSCDKINF